MDGLLIDIKYLDSVNVIDDLELFLRVPYDNYHRIKRDAEYKAGKNSLCKYRFCRDQTHSHMKNKIRTTIYKYCKKHLSMFHPELRCIVPNCTAIRVHRNNQFLMCHRHCSNRKSREQIHDNIMDFLEHGCVIDGVQYDITKQ
jgi:hypothetical protein